MAGNKNTDRLRSNKPPLFSPTTVDYIKNGSNNDSVFKKDDGSEFEDTSIGLSASFKYNPIGQGLVSTQQLNVDWTKFENHTFFNSAQVKTNVAFDKIINQFPFDGTRKEVEIFFDELTGFEKWVYDQIPKQRGYLYFSGSTVSVDNGTYITTKDYAGANYPSISTKIDGATILEPYDSSMTIEAHVYVPSQSLGNLNQYILYKSNNANINGFALTLETNTGSSTADLSMLLVDGDAGQLEDKAIIPVNYDEWNHVAWVWDRTPGIDKIKGYLNTKLVSSSSTPYLIGEGGLGTEGQNLYIGSGSALGTFIPNTTFSGALDELRIWHDARSESELKQYQKKLVWPDDTLKLYYKFNEPSGSNTDIVLDYSNNSLHGKLNTRGLTLGIRDIPTGSLLGASPMTLESFELSPILFPKVKENVDLRVELLTSASNYDLQNPNLITKLVPPHYFEEGMALESFESIEGYITEDNTDVSGDNPRENILGGTQAMLSLLYTWAKFFDEMKLYIQAFSALKNLNYDTADTIPTDFLSVFAQMEGIELPPLFVGTDIEQYIEGQNLDNEISNSILSLQNIQNEIWKRVLINMRSVARSKGTLHSIKTFIRSVGINPDSVFRIREYGGPIKNHMSFTRENRYEVATMLDFVSGGFIISNALSGSTNKNEPGWPLDGPTTAMNNVYTSGSFTYEGTYRFIPTIDYQYASQSLARMKFSSSLAAINGEGTTMVNLVAVTGAIGSGINKTTVTLFADGNLDTSTGSTEVPIVNLSITGADIFDGDQWYISFGRFRNDDPGIYAAKEQTLEGAFTLTSPSSSWFLRLAKNINGEIAEIYTTSSFFLDDNTSMFQNVGSSSLYHGPYLLIGSSSLDSDLYGSDPHTGVLERTVSGSNIPAAARTVEFEGRVSQIRFWSKALLNNEWKEHVRNYKSVGVADPKTNFNFVSKNVSGSWQRLRLDASTDQINLQADSSGLIDITDFTQNNQGMTGENFPANKKVILPEHFYYSQLTAEINEGASNKKVRSRSYIDLAAQEEKNEHVSKWAQTAPVYEVNPFLEVSDSTKLTIDYKVTEFLDQDIITLFSSFDEYNNMIGRPELLFSAEYKDLDTMRQIYFNKLESKMNIKGFFEFYKWFDTNIGTFVKQLTPRKTKFEGTNFVISSHFLERAKVQYHFEDVYLGEDIRSGLKDRILLQLITGRFDRY